MGKTLMKSVGMMIQCPRCRAEVVGLSSHVGRVHQGCRPRKKGDGTRRQSEDFKPGRWEARGGGSETI
jgi:hypothetical protein